MKTIILLEHRTAKEFLLKKANEWGYRVVMVASEHKDFFSKYLAPSDIVITDVFELQSVVEKVFFHVQRHGLKIDAVLTFSDDLVVAAADIAALVGCPGIGQLSARQTSANKIAMRTALQKAGVSQPQFSVFNIFDSKDDFILEEFPKPCVIKPQFGTTSHGVFMVGEDLGVEEIRSQIKMTVNTSVRESFRYFAGNMLVEEYIAGKMVSVDGFVSDGTVSIVGSIEFVMGNEPFFTQTASYIPARLNDKERGSLKDVLHKVVDALGFEYAPFHAEFRIKDNEAYLIEIAGRMAGATIHETYDRVYGIDMIGTMYSVMLGDSVQGDPVSKGTNFHMLYYPKAQKSGSLVRIEGVDTLLGHEEVVGLKVCAKVGDYIQTYPNTPTPLFEFSIFTQDLDRIEDIIIGLERDLKYEIR